MAHVDQSEIDMEAPLISISLGYLCIYLIGGNTRETKPILLQLNSGDIIIMPTIASKAYHDRSFFREISVLRVINEHL